MKLRCSTCGEEHDLDSGEIGYDLPDDYFALSAEERTARGKANTDLCELDGRHFIRGVLPIPVLGENRSFGWGVWAEVSPDAFRRYYELYSNPDQGSERPFPGALANSLPGYPETLGLLLSVQMVSAEDRPTLTVTSEHPLRGEQLGGIYPERVLELMSPWLHAESE